jgi:hypothetical protein
LVLLRLQPLDTIGVQQQQQQQPQYVVVLSKKNEGLVCHRKMPSAAPNIIMEDNTNLFWAYELL